MTVIRVRTSAGTHRIELGSETETTIKNLKDKVKIALNGARGRLAMSPDGRNELSEADDGKTLAKCDVRHGAMLYFIPASAGEAIPPPPKVIPPASFGGNHSSASVMEGLTSSSTTTTNGGVGNTSSSTSTESRVKRSIDANGNVVISARTDDAAFRPGLTSLRAQKMHWTLTEMTELDSQYTFVMKGDEVSNCASVSLDLKSAQQFQEYLRAFKFQRPRMGWMYGRYVVVKDPSNPATSSSTSTSGPSSSPGMESNNSSDSNPPNKERKYGDTKGAKRIGDLPGKKDEAKSQLGVVVEAIYEPPQDVDPATGEIRVKYENDEFGQRANDIMMALGGMKRVGIIFSHPPRESSPAALAAPSSTPGPNASPPPHQFHFSGQEILMSGNAALDSTEGSRTSPFVVVKVSCDEKGATTMEGYSLTQTALDMVAEEALLVMRSRPGFLAVKETFTAIVEAKTAEVIDTDYLLKRVPILSHTSPMSCAFPRFFREYDAKPSGGSLKKIIGDRKFDWKAPKELADLSLLLFLSEAGLDMDTITQISRCLRPHVFPKVKRNNLDAWDELRMEEEERTRVKKEVKRSMVIADLEPAAKNKSKNRVEGGTAAEEDEEVVELPEPLPEGFVLIIKELAQGS